MRAFRVFGYCLLVAGVLLGVVPASEGLFRIATETWILWSFAALAFGVARIPHRLVADEPIRPAGPRAAYDR